MGEKSNNARNLIIAVVILAAIGVAGYFYAGRDQSANDTLLTSVSVGTSTAVDSDLLSALSELRRLKLDDSIFSNPSWSTLHDFSQTLSPLPSGRPNPFAPLDSSLAATSSSF